MDRCAVGDLDNDGINELATWYKDPSNPDSAFILIYKCVGDDEYELFMEELVYMEDIYSPFITSMLIADLDQNGQKELIYTYNKVYLWEFSEPGNYSIWSSNIIFQRVVSDAEVCDVDQDGIPELAFVTATTGQQPPCMYIIREFSNKAAWPSYAYAFTTITNFWQDWADYRLAVGDFDNDGVMDIVSGNFASVWTYDPVDIQYFRYDSTVVNNFTQEWLHTGIPLSCATPVIADMDNDGENELFAGGIVRGTDLLMPGKAPVLEPDTFPGWIPAVLPIAQMRAASALLTSILPLLPSTSFRELLTIPSSYSGHLLITAIRIYGRAKLKIPWLFAILTSLTWIPMGRKISY